MPLSTTDFPVTQSHQGSDASVQSGHHVGQRQGRQYWRAVGKPVHCCESGPSFHLSVHDDPAVETRDGHLAAVELHIKIESWAPADLIAVKLDGQPLGQPAVRNLAAENPDDPSEVDENSWLVWPLTPECAARGDHAIEVCLVERDPRMIPPLVVQHVEIHIRYR